MGYVSVISKVAGVLGVPFVLGAFVVSASAQEPVQIAPADGNAPPAVVLKPDGDTKIPAGAVGAGDDMVGGGMDAAGDVAAPGIGSPPAMQNEPVETAAPDGAAEAVATIGELVGKPVVDAQGKKVGLVTDVKMASDGAVKELHVRTSGFFGFGAKTLIVPSNVIETTDATVKLKLASADLSKLEVVRAPKS